ncbi:outer membrane protein assembly factor BamB [Marinomonas sp. C2222]|uniref:Outer membrane protein assembly factor BamB n=1 Tax=Marinomonas sargassi TaxID=2984494 RepID=A0ABT2YRS4_9GAMM|nr:outer membrane protein assembly factor BamB [Marinomonas sargassi]MCV2402571.1 outer membrane protein assembly factor BamB [Marinomonas sargassi]
MINKSVFIASLFSVLLVQGCSNARPDLDDLPRLEERQVELKRSWKTSVDGNFGESSERFNLVAEDNALFLVTEKGTLYELAQKDGHKNSKVETKYKASSGVTRNGDTLYFGTYDGFLVAVSLSTKEVLWETVLSSEVLSEASYAAGKLAVQTTDGRLSLLDAQTGAILWGAKEDIPALTVRGTSSPIIYQGKVLAGFSNGKLNAYSLQSGALQWSYEVGKPEGRYEIERLSDLDGRLVVNNGVVYAVAYNGNLVALSVSSGRPLWQRNIPSSVGLAVKNDQLAVVDMQSKVILLNAKNGSEIWQNNELVNRDLISPEFFRDYLAVIDRESYIHLLDLTTGNIAARRLTNDDVPPGSRLVTGSNQLFLLTPDADVTALSY